jgi:hypothetical protein
MTVAILNTQNRRFLGIICLVNLVGILIAGLWPFNFWSENEVKWLNDRSGLQFYGRGIVYSETPMEWWIQSSNISTKPFSFEICLQAETELAHHLPHIFSMCDRSQSETFFFGQWKSHLILGKGIHGKAGYREVGIKDILKKGERRVVAITSGAEGTRIYVDGALAESRPKFLLFATDEKPGERIVLGNSPAGNGYWMGKLFGLVLYNRALTGEEVYQHFRNWTNRENSLSPAEEGIVALYPFDERSGNLARDHVDGRHLSIPSRFGVLQKTILVPPWRDFRLNRAYLKDIVTNILGFIPFGFFLPACLRRRKPYSNFSLFLLSILIAGCLSLFIELTQVYLPTRSSQLTDVITNILGAAIGAALFFKTQLSLRPLRAL